MFSYLIGEFQTSVVVTYFSFPELSMVKTVVTYEVKYLLVVNFTYERKCL